MTRKSCIIFLSFFFLVSWAHGAKLTTKTWQKDPEIVAIRKIFETNNLHRKQWKKTTKTWDYCASYVDTKRILIEDENHVPRIYINSGGSDDSTETLEHHYDENGRLRFVFIKGGAVNESILEHRIYFNKGGERIWEMHRYTRGPGYTFPSVWPKNELTFDPRKAFSSTSECDKN